MTDRSIFNPQESAREQALAGARLASFGQRFVGYLIDLVVAIMLWAPLEIAWRVFVLKEQEVHLIWDFHEAGNIVVLLLYHGVCNYFWDGRTAGKRLAGTRIVSLTHDHMSAWQSIERALGYGAAVLELGLGFLQFFWSRNRMCAQDRLAETVVLDIRLRP